MRHLPRPLSAVPIVAIGMALLLLAAPARAQYSFFGQNKVQYKDFKYEVLHTEHFDIYFYAEERPAVEQAARMAERWYARLARLFTHKLSSRQPLILYASGPDFRQTNVIEGDLGEGTGGVTEPFKRRVILPLGASLAETDHVLGHELVHAFQYDITSVTSQQGVPGLERLPLWFVEGMAEYVSLGPVDPNTAMWMRDAVMQNKLPAIKKLNDPRYFPYRWGQALWAYITGRWGDRMIPDLLSAAAAAGDTDLAFEKLLGVKTDQLSDQWQAALKSEYEPIIAATKPTSDYGKLVIGGKGLGQDLNVSPAISPDGRRMLFLSSRSLFSIDLYSADAQTGKNTNRIIQTDTNPHWSSLQFIASAGDWEPNGRRFVFGGVTDGRPVLALLDVDSGKITREIPFPKLGEIFSPTWSPDSRAIAFSASNGGYTDLFVYDLETATLKQLTKDAYADLQPAWSPDGKRIAFVTDRFSTNLVDLQSGNYRLAFIDPATGQIESAPGFDHAKNINPQWSQDGASLYFVSDHSGISNIYRLTVASGTIAQVTNIATGVTGITDLSPALSVAGRSNALAFSAYHDGKYEIYSTEASDQLPATEPVSLPGPAAVLPPPTQRLGDWPAVLNNPTVGLPPASAETKVTDYKPKLGLDFVGQPYVAVGADRFGTYAGGGITFVWSDMMGNHQLATQVQITSGLNGSFKNIFKDSGALVAYQDLSHRWNWGVSAQQMPYLSGGFGSYIDQMSNGALVGVDQTVLYRQLFQSAGGMLAYPFSRAQRLEVSASFSRISFSQDVRTTVYSLDTGQVISDQTDSTKLADTLTLAQPSAALVYDTAIYGATSPIRGQSYRLEYAPSFGSINYSSVLADYRRYFMPVQLYTIAGRVLHYGRYGSGSEDYRMYPLYLGYPNLVRGYDIGSFSTSDCPITSDGSCPDFDRLIGSRMLVGNLEFRFPLLRPFGLREGVYGPVPVEVAFFGDAGVAWTRQDKPAIFGGDRKAVTSAGVALRVNVFGYAVLEFDLVRPFQRYEYSGLNQRKPKGWVFQFGFTPGF